MRDAAGNDAGNAELHQAHDIGIDVRPAQSETECRRAGRRSSAREIARRLRRRRPRPAHSRSSAGSPQPAPLDDRNVAIITRLSRMGAAAAAAKRLQAVEHPALQGGERHEEEIGKGDPRHRAPRDRSSRGSSAKPGAITYMRSGMAISATAVKTQQPGEQHRIDVLGEALALRLAAWSRRFANSGTKAELKAPSANRAAEQIGKAESDDEGLRDGAGADHRGDHHVANKAEVAADERDSRRPSLPI